MLRRNTSDQCQCVTDGAINAIRTTWQWDRTSRHIGHTSSLRPDAPDCGGPDSCCSESLRATKSRCCWRGPVIRQPQPLSRLGAAPSLIGRSPSPACRVSVGNAPSRSWLRVVELSISAPARNHCFGRLGPTHCIVSGIVLGIYAGWRRGGALRPYRHGRVPCCSLFTPSF